MTNLCQYRIEFETPKRRANALNIEVGTPMPRCRLKPPEHWGPDAPSALRWLYSGGDPMVFGKCLCSPEKTADCKLRTQHGT